MSIFGFFETHPDAFIAVMLLLGLAVGSFINVVIHRLPRIMEATWRTECDEILGMDRSVTPERFDLMQPPSVCPACGHRIAALEKIPVVSYLVLRGRCSACGWQIPARYPIIEICGALIAGAAAGHFGFTTAAMGATLLGWGLLTISVIDFDTGLLPDAITLPLLWLGLAFNLFDTFASLHDSVLGAMAGYLLFRTLYHGLKFITGREGMGHGDFKLLALLGAWLGWQVIPAIVLLSSLAGAVVGITLIALRRCDRSSPLPFGPYLAAAGLIALFFGNALSAIYLGYPNSPT